MMSIFINIEAAIEETRAELNAIIYKDREGNLRPFEERRIDWEHNGIRKAIIIQPTFESGDINAELWNFTLVAWAWIDKTHVSYLNQVIVKSDFAIIEADIKNLLANGKQILLNIAVNDLK